MIAKNVLVVIGVGGIGKAIARRQGAGCAVLLADYDERSLHAATEELGSTGYAVTAKPVDVANRGSVHELADEAARLGNVTGIVNTAGLSPNMASADKILAVDLLGTALVLEEFGNIVAPRGAGIVISSMAGYMLPPLAPEIDHALAHTPADELLGLQALQPSAVSDPGTAYAISKRANHLRIQSECLRWAERGARLNSISPGIIMTPMAQKEMASPIGAGYRAMIEASAAKRVGTSEEIASAAAYLLSAEAGFVTGSDLLIDGGVIAAMRSGSWQVNLG